MNKEALLATLGLASQLKKSVQETIKPPSDTGLSQDEPVIYMALVRDTRDYIVKISHQINGAYANGWYDACAVMIRRLLETLIIECFETHGIKAKITGADGDYFYLRDLVDRACNEPTWTLGRNVKRCLPKLKDVGDKSAHSRRFNAHREDIDKLNGDLRDAVQELIAIAKLKRMK